MQTYITKSATCPCCHKEINAASTMDKTEVRGPQPNDLTICLGCAEVLMFTEDMSLVPFSVDSVEQLPGDLKDSVNYMCDVVRKVISTNNQGK